MRLFIIWRIMKAYAGKMTLSRLVNILQDIAHEGKAQYEVDLDLETHVLSGFEVDDENQKIVLKSEEAE